MPSMFRGIITVDAAENAMPSSIFADTANLDAARELSELRHVVQVGYFSNDIHGLLQSESENPGNP